MFVFMFAFNFINFIVWIIKPIPNPTAIENATTKPAINPIFLESNFYGSTTSYLLFIYSIEAKV